MIQLKICGMKEPRNISEVAALGPSFMGFIFYPNSPRFVGVDFRLPHDFPDNIKRVGVFVNQFFDEIDHLARLHKLDFLQLHGDESVEDVRRLRNEGWGIIKVFRVDHDFSFAIVAPYVSCVDYFLFDTRGKFYGGNGRVFDWGLLNRYTFDLPFFLSGGIQINNLSDIGNISDHLFAIDVNSGVEVSPGIKDVAKVDHIIKYLKPDFKRPYEKI